MLVVQAGVKVMKVEYRQGIAEIVSETLRRTNTNNIKVMTVHTLPRTNKWPVHVHGDVLTDTLDSMKKIMKNLECSNGREYQLWRA